MDIRSALERKLKCDHPTDEQLALMNRWKPSGQPDYVANELLSVPILASTNMLRHDMTVWTEKALQSMAATYGGESFMLNHDWGDVKQAIGFVYDSEIIRIPAGGIVVKNLLMDMSINADVDEMVYDKQGFIGVICYAAIPAESSAAGAIRYRQLSDVSTGGMFNRAKYICPLCGGDFGPEDEHWPPSDFTYWLAEQGDLDPELIAPFVWKDGWHNSFELSFVTVGNVPQATIFVEDLLKLIWV
jgi:hypothetical protein